MRKLKIMADYFCYPLWEKTADYFENIDPKNLKISTNLINRFYKWSDKYDETFNELNPKDSGFKSKNEERIFYDEGIQLKLDLQSEIGSYCSVELFLPSQLT